MSIELIIITGMSGSGKSVALHALEDAGYYCVDNLPPELLKPLLTIKAYSGHERLGISMDARSTQALEQLPLLLSWLEREGVRLRMIFLEADNQTLVRRFSETRRRHPLSQPNEHAGEGLLQAIKRERDLLSSLRERAHVIETSHLRSSQLLGYIKELITAPAVPLLLVFESFAFKRGITRDADFVFDVRMLPNPHYEPKLQQLTGLDQPVIDFLDRQPQAQRMLLQIGDFLEGWLPQLEHDHRSYVTVAIGCTGGQHRSVYLVEKLAARFAAHWQALKRHRELERTTG